MSTRRRRQIAYWRDAKRLAKQRRDEQRPTAAIAAELTRELGLFALQAWRYANGYWSREKLVAECSARGYSTITLDVLVRAERNESYPSAQALGELEAILGASAQQLGYGPAAAPAVADATVLVDAAIGTAYPKKSRGGRIGRSALTAQAASLSSPPEDPMHEPGLSSSNPSPSSSFDPAPHEVARALTTGTISPEQVGYERAVIAQIAAQWDNPQAGPALLSEAKQHYLAHGKALNHKQPGKIQRELAHNTAELGAIIGLMLWVYDPRPYDALNYWETSVLAATEAGDRPLGAWVRMTQASRLVCTAQQLYPANPQASASYARQTLQAVQQGLSLAKRRRRTLGRRPGPNPTVALLHGIGAIAHAVLEDHASAGTAMRQAERISEQVSLIPRATTPGTTDEAWWRFFSSMASLQVRDGRRALEHGERAVDLWRDSPSGAAIMTEIDLAAAPLLDHDRDLEAACAALRKALELPPEALNVWILAHAQWVLQQPFGFAPYAGEMMVGELAEQIQTLSSTQPLSAPR